MYLSDIPYHNRRTGEAKEAVELASVRKGSNAESKKYDKKVRLNPSLQQNAIFPGKEKVLHR